MERYGSAEYGLIIKPKHIVSASDRDTYTLNTRDDEDDLFNIRLPQIIIKILIIKKKTFNCININWR